MANLKGILDSIRKIMWTDTGLNGDAQRIEQLGWMLFYKIFSDKDKELELMDDNYVSPIPAELHWDEWAGDDEGITGDELQSFVDNKLFKQLKDIQLVPSEDVKYKRALILREVFEGNNNYMKSRLHKSNKSNKTKTPIVLCELIGSFGKTNLKKCGVYLYLLAPLGTPGCSLRV